MQTSSKVLAGIIIVAVIGFFVYWMGNSSATPVVDNSNSNTDNTIGNNQTSAAQETTNPNGTTTSIASGYKDGTYSSTQSYMSPGGSDSLGVTVTLKNNLISQVSVKNMANDGTSKMYQNRFIGAIQSVVAGKSITNLKVGVVSGASLASNAFNAALAQVRTQASN